MATETDKWWLEEHLPEIFEKGNYEATIAAKDCPKKDYSPGLSACAWEISEARSTLALLAEARLSHSKKSDEQKGYVAAALGAISTFEGHIALTIYTNSEYVVGGLNGDAQRWKENGWKKTKGRPVKYPELWEKILGVISARSISVQARHVSKDDWIPYARVFALADECLRRKTNLSKRF